MTKMKKFKVFELDFGDTNLLTEDSRAIADWIQTDMENMQDDDELQYTITIRYMTRKQIENLPEWA
jgi:hypothetical protein